MPRLTQGALDCIPIVLMCYERTVIERNKTLENAFVRLEPLTRGHLPGIAASASAAAVWQFTFQNNPFGARVSAEAWFRDATQTPDVRAFAIIDRPSGEICGSTRYLDINGQHRKLEIGWTFLAPKWWRSHVNTQAKLLLLSYAFEEWNAVRVQFKAEAVNERSHRAILRLGATHEGTLRSFRIRSDTGERRDVAFYSILDSEWPAIKTRLTSR